MESSFIPNSNLAIGQTSTPSSARSKKPNECGRGLPWRAVLSRRSVAKAEALGEGGSAPNCCEFSLVRRSAFDVRHSAFSLQSAIRRVKGAWWPSRSSKPLLIPHTRDQDRFDSYPLRRSKFDGRWVMFEVATTSNLQSTIKLQTSNFLERR